MFVLDMHCDSLLAVNAESGLIKPYNFSNKYPHLQFVAEFCPKSNEDPFTRRKRLMRLLDLYLYECERLGISQIKSVKDLIRFETVGGTHALLSIEGGGGLFADSEELPTLMNAGLFVMGLAWDDNELSKSAWCSEDTGLTDKGRELTKRAEELGIIIDVSHLSDKAFYDTLEIYQSPVLATHSNFRSVCNSKRNLTDDMALKIAKRGGVIGINLYPPFLSESKTATLNDVLRHVEHGLSLLGENALGFGFDIDGTSEQYPTEISLNESIHDQIINLLLSHYSESVVRKIAGENALNFLKENIML